MSVPRTPLELAAAELPPALLARARTRELRAGARLFRRNDRPGFMHYVIAGEIRLVRLSRAGQETILQRVSRGYVAEASLEGARYHCDGLAAAPSRVLCMPKAAFLEALERDAGFRTAWRRHLAEELRRMRARCERLALRAARDRVAHYIESEGAGAIELAQSRKSWALELGITHEALYRALAGMQREGVLEVSGARLRLRRPPPLMWPSS